MTDANERVVRFLRATPEQQKLIDSILDGNEPKRGETKTVSPTFEEFITKQELARRLSKTPRSIDAYMAAGIVPFYKLGRTVVFRYSEICEHLREHYRVGRRSLRTERSQGLREKHHA